MMIFFTCARRCEFAEGCKYQQQHAGFHMSCSLLGDAVRGVCPCGNGKCKDFAATPVVACVQMGEASKTRSATTKARRSSANDGGRLTRGPERAQSQTGVADDAIPWEEEDDVACPLSAVRRPHLSFFLQEKTHRISSSEPSASSQLRGRRRRPTGPLRGSRRCEPSAKRGLAGMPHLGRTPQHLMRSPGCPGGRAWRLASRLAVPRIAYTLTLLSRSRAAAHLGTGSPSTVAVPVGPTSRRVAHGYTRGQVHLAAAGGHANRSLQTAPVATPHGPPHLWPTWARMPKAVRPLGRPRPRLHTQWLLGTPREAGRASLARCMPRGGGKKKTSCPGCQWHFLFGISFMSHCCLVLFGI